MNSFINWNLNLNHTETTDTLVTTLSRSGIMVDPESIPRTLGKDQEYILGQMPVLCRASI